MEKKFTGLSLNIILSSVFILLFYHNVIFNPNSYLFTDWGDGIKNYYTYEYYINNNKDTWNLEGFNYPYGENMFYTDCHPVIAYTLKKLDPVFPVLGENSIGIINFFMIFSLIFTALLSYLILKKFKLPEWLSALAGFSIMVLSPQIGRITGHLALTYSFFIPLTIYLLMLYEESRKAVWMIVQTINIFFWLVIHAYLGMIAASFLLAYFIVEFIRDFQRKKKSTAFYYKVFIQVFLPIIIFRLIIYFTDTHVGRTDNPWGFFFTRANFGSVFLPHDKPLNIIYKWIGQSPRQRWEGWAYIGIVSSVISISYVLRQIKRGLRTKKWSLTDPFFTDKQLQALLISAFLILLFSMAVPFKYGLEFLLDWFKVLKQFRATGRFAWVFFFIINYLVIIYLYNKFKTAKNRKLALLVLILFPLANTIEGWNQHKYFSKEIIKKPNYFQKDNLPDYFKTALQKINPDDYQAILPLPFYYIGGENFGHVGNNKSFFATELTSYHTKLPILGSHLTRNGILEAKNINQVISPRWNKKVITDDIKSNKPFLIVRSQNPLNSYEQDILNRSKAIYLNDTMSYYEISYDELLKKNTDEAINNFIADSSQLFSLDGFLTNDSAAFIYEGFDSLLTNKTYRGLGAFTCKRGGTHVVLSFNGNSLELGENYILSFWIYNCGRNYGQDILNMQTILESKSEDGNVKWTQFRPSESTVINGCWSFVELPFSPKPGYTYKLLTSASKKPKQDIIIDEVFIYKADSKYYKILNGDKSDVMKLFFNNQDIVKN